MIYEKIYGMFNFQDVYDLAINEALKRESNIFIEVGGWLGKSSSYMAERIKLTGTKNIINFYVYDTWQGGGELDIYNIFPELKTNKLDNIFHYFFHNTYELRDYFIPVKSDSIKACSLHSDNSIDFVYLDDNHEYEHVKIELSSWWSKIKEGGILAGHDYPHKPIEKAVKEFALEINKKIILMSNNSSWMIRK